MTTGKGYGDVDKQQEEIQSTRAELGDTVHALAAKTDVKARGREKAAETRNRVREQSVEAVDTVREKAVQVPRTLEQKTTQSTRMVGQKALQMPKKVVQDVMRRGAALRQRATEVTKTAGQSGAGGFAAIRGSVRRAGTKARQNPPAATVAVAAVIAGVVLARKYGQSTTRTKGGAARWGAAQLRRSALFDSKARQPRWRF
jgi:hypothetical protein